MKGVIVQVGEPKSIVLFNNGKIGAIPTPADCQVGMVVTVTYNHTLKIAIISLAAVLLLATGVAIGIGIKRSVSPAMDNSPPAAAPVIEDDETYSWQRGQKKRQEIEERFSE